MHNKMRTVRRVEFELLGRCRFGIPWYAERCRIEAHRRRGQEGGQKDSQEQVRKGCDQGAPAYVIDEDIS